MFRFCGNHLTLPSQYRTLKPWALWVEKHTDGLLKMLGLRKSETNGQEGLTEVSRQVGMPPTDIAQGAPAGTPQ